MIVVYLDHYEWFLRITDDVNEPIKAEISGTKRSGYNVGINNDILTTPCSEQHRQLLRTNLVKTLSPRQIAEGFFLVFDFYRAEKSAWERIGVENILSCFIGCELPVSPFIETLCEMMLVARCVGYTDFKGVFFPHKLL